MESIDETGLTLQQLAEDKYAKIMKDVEDVSNLIGPSEEDGHYQLFVEKNEIKVFVYCHSAYASFSSVKLSNVFKTIRLTVSESFTFKSCDKNDEYHLHLLPYFYSNVGLLGQLKMIKSNTVNEEMISKIDIDCSNLSAVIEKKRLEGCTGNDSVYYEALKDSSQKALHLSEDVWSFRLYHGIKRSFPHIVTHFTADLRGYNALNSYKSYVPEKTDAAMFLFLGASDFLISSYPLLSVEDEESNGGGNSGKLIPVENSKQEGQYRCTGPYYIPEKGGELFAAVHHHIVASCLSSLAAGKQITPPFLGNGLLLTKNYGIWKMMISIGEDNMNMNVEIFQEGSVTPAALCNALQSINPSFKEH